jgi:hypothetical protein
VHKGQRMSLLALLVMRWQAADPPGPDTPAAHEFLLEIVRRGGGGPHDCVPTGSFDTVATSVFFKWRRALLQRVELEYAWARHGPLVALRAARLAAAVAVAAEVDGVDGADRCPHRSGELVPLQVDAVVAATEISSRKRSLEEAAEAVIGPENGGGGSGGCCDAGRAVTPPSKRQRLNGAGGDAAVHVADPAAPAT